MAKAVFGPGLNYTVLCPSCDIRRHRIASCWVAFVKQSNAGSANGGIGDYRRHSDIENMMTRPFAQGSFKQSGIRTICAGLAVGLPRSNSAIGVQFNLDKGEPVGWATT